MLPLIVAELVLWGDLVVSFWRPEQMLPLIVAELFLLDDLVVSIWMSDPREKENEFKNNLRTYLSQL